MAVVDLYTGKVTGVSAIPGHHNEPEGIFPDGRHTLVESSRQFIGERLRNPVQYIDIWKLSLDGNEPPVIEGFTVVEVNRVGDIANEFETELRHMAESEEFNMQSGNNRDA